MLQFIPLFLNYRPPPSPASACYMQKENEGVEEINSTVPYSHFRCNLYTDMQCSGSVSFWTYWIRIRKYIVRIRILPSTGKKIKKNLDFCCLVT
jgi:hypothetical protein